MSTRTVSTQAQLDAAITAAPGEWIRIEGDGDFDVASDALLEIGGSSRPSISTYGASRPSIRTLDASQPSISTYGASQPSIQAGAQSQVHATGHAHITAGPNVALVIDKDVTVTGGGHIVREPDLTEGPVVHMTPWLWLGLIAGAALQHLTALARRARWQRREAYRAHVQAIAMRRQLVDAARGTRLDVVIERARGRAS